MLYGSELRTSCRVTNSIALESMTTVLHAPPTCKKCGCEKVWHKSKSLKAGGRWKCPACGRESDRRWKRANPGKNAASTRAWAQANPGENAAKSRAWAQANPEKKAAQDRAWSQANPEKRNAIKHRHRARKRNATVPGRHVTAAIEAKRKALFGGCCFCDSQEKLTLEHMVALNNGGLHVEENLFGSCMSCNCSKKDNPVEEWFRSQPFFSVERWKRLNEVACAEHSLRLCD